MNDPILNAMLNGSIRPLNERMRRQLENQRQFILEWDADYEALLNGVADSVVIDDGRTDTPARTVGDLRAWIRFQRFLGLLARHRGNVDQNQLQNAFNAFQNGNVNVEQSLVKFTARTGIFEG